MAEQRYKVIVRQAGELLAEVFVTALNSLSACQKAEQKLNAKRRRCQLDEDRIVFWSGLDLEARKLL